MSLNLLNRVEDYSDRYDALIVHIEEVKPTVVAFQEAIETGLEYLQDIMFELGYPYHAYHFAGPVKVYDGEDHRYGNITFSRAPIVNEYVVNYNEMEAPALFGGEFVPSTIVTVVNIGEGETIAIANNHLAWHSSNEAYRQWQVAALSEELEMKSMSATATLMVGGFNSTENTDTMRYLRGETFPPHLEPTFWVDAYEHKGSLDEYATTGPSLPFASDTAYVVGISMPEELPERRIDYILSKGWCYGKTGSPLTFVRASLPDVSDHYAIYSDILVTRVSDRI